MFLAGDPFNADDIEAVVNIMEMIAASVLASDTANLLLLVSMHRLFRSAAHVTGPGLHLDERAERATRCGPLIANQQAPTE